MESDTKLESSAAGKFPNTQSDNPFPAIGLGELLDFKYPPREMLLDPWLPARSLSMIHGPRGVGKTYLTLSIALAVASGGQFLGWSSSRNSRVLYIDGEITCTELQERCFKLLGSTPATVPLDFMPRDSYPSWMPYLDNPGLQSAIEANIKEDTTLIVVDNLSTLWRGKENEDDCWDQMQEWMAKQKQKGRSVLLVHHTNKKGDQRGSNRKEDNLDVVIGLRRPDSYTQAEGARFIVEFTKCRSLHGTSANPFEARLVNRPGHESHGLEWQGQTPRSEDTYSKVVELMLSGFGQKEIAVRLAKDKGTISRHWRAAIQKGVQPGDNLLAKQSCMVAPIGERNCATGS